MNEGETFPNMEHLCVQCSWKIFKLTGLNRDIKDDQLVAALQISRYWMFIVELYPIIHVKRKSEESFLLIASAQPGHESHHVGLMGRRCSDCS